MTEACIMRSKEMNELKKSAVNTGNNFYTLNNV